MQRASKENFERETLVKTRLTHPQFSSFDSPNFFTLTLSIVTSLRGTLAKTFLLGSKDLGFMYLES